MPTPSILVAPSTSQCQILSYVRCTREGKRIAARNSLSLHAGLNSGGARQEERDSGQSHPILITCCQITHFHSDRRSGVRNSNDYFRNSLTLLHSEPHRPSFLLFLPASYTIAVNMTTELEKSPEVSPFDGLSPRDWDAFRLQSLAPGGFGDARAYIWHAFLYGHFPPFS